MEKINIVEFKARYATNKHRIVLFEELERFLEKVDDFLSPYSVAIYGSYITDKSDPSDVDLLLHGFVKETKHSDYTPKTLVPEGHVHLQKFITSYTLCEKKLKDMSVIIDEFCSTEANRERRFEINEYVEILF
ncbi:DUF6932 family protein [Idiomarina loihiensis]|uniref:DUF6932 family protein n=1 Tax=Idiomarina loihiensis TaxID=135577 RepID=UPI00315898B3